MSEIRPEEESDTVCAAYDGLSRELHDPERQAHELRVLFDVGKAVTSSLSFNDMIRALESSVKRLVYADATAFAILDDQRKLRIIGGADLKRYEPVPEHHDLCQDIATDVAITGRPQCVACVPNSAHCRFIMMDRANGGSHHVASVPLIRMGQPIGSISVFRQNAEPFAESEIELLKTFASVAAIAVGNSLAFERERRVAETLQRGLLPRDDFDIPGFAVGSSYRAATEESKMGGDIYDVIQLGSGRYGVLIADISGKGIDAAVYTAMVKYMARGLLMSEVDLSSVITKLNMAACQDLPPDMFITLFLGLLDSGRREITYVNAGHDQPIHYVRESDSCVFLESTGRPIGVIESSTYSVERASLSSGDLLVFYTDGVTDARRDGKFLGIEGLERLIRKNVPAPPDELVRRIFASVSRFARNQLQDDAAVLAIKAL